jgi:hypothetical protein
MFSLLSIPNTTPVRDVCLFLRHLIPLRRSGSRRQEIMRLHSTHTRRRRAHTRIGSIPTLQDARKRRVLRRVPFISISISMAFLPHLLYLRPSFPRHSSELRLSRGLGLARSRCNLLFCFVLFF